MQPKNVKKLLHDKRNSRRRQIRYWANQSEENRKTIGFTNGTILQWPIVNINDGRDLHNLNDDLNSERYHGIFEILNWQVFNSKRNQKLQDYYNQKKAVRWRALADSISVKTIDGHTKAYLLLDQVTDIAKLPTDVDYAILDTQYCDCVIDKHMWLPLEYIKYLGDHDEMSISQGDVIEGESYIHRYYSQGQYKYGLADTILYHSGIFTGTDETITFKGDVVTGMNLIDHYERSDIMLKLTYTSTYSAKLNRYRVHDLEHLHYLKGHVTYHWDINAQIDYQMRFMLKPDSFDNLKRVIKANKDNDSSPKAIQAFQNLISHQDLASDKLKDLTDDPPKNAQEIIKQTEQSWKKHNLL